MLKVACCHNDLAGSLGRQSLATRSFWPHLAYSRIQLPADSRAAAPPSFSYKRGTSHSCAFIMDPRGIPAAVRRIEKKSQLTLSRCFVSNVDMLCDRRSSVFQGQIGRIAAPRRGGMGREREREGKKKRGFYLLTLSVASSTSSSAPFHSLFRQSFTVSIVERVIYIYINRK